MSRLAENLAEQVSDLKLRIENLERATETPNPSEPPEEDRQNRRIVFPEKGKAQIEDCPVPTPAPNDILIRNVVTVVSPGTELAHLHGPQWTDRHGNVRPTYPTYPGYMAAGIVEKCGNAVEHATQGDRVAYAGGHTAYGITRADSDYLWPIPASLDVSWSDAALTRLAVTARHGITVATETLGRYAQKFTIVGDGLLAQLVARWLDPKAEVKAVTAHCLRAAQLERVGVSTFDDARGALGGDAPVVFLCADTWSALAAAVEAATIGGVIVMLAAPRRNWGTDSHDYPHPLFLRIHQRGLRVVGAVAGEVPATSNFRPQGAGNRWIRSAGNRIDTGGLVKAWNYNSVRSELDANFAPELMYIGLRDRTCTTYAIYWSKPSEEDTE